MFGPHHCGLFWSTVVHGVGVGGVVWMVRVEGFVWINNFRFAISPTYLFDVPICVQIYKYVIQIWWSQ